MLLSVHLQSQDELQSALLAVRMNRMIQRELDTPVNETFYWTDSMIVLSYIHNTTKRFQTYVANQVNEIRESSDPTQWRNKVTLFARSNAIGCIILIGGRGGRRIIAYICFISVQ